MTYQSNPNAEGATNGEFNFNRFQSDKFGRAKRPGFTPAKALAVVAGVAIFPPLGIAALAYFIWNERRCRHFNGNNFAGRGFGDGNRSRGGCGRGNPMGRSGNVAFDEHRAKVLNELDAESQAFAEDRAEQRSKRDKEAFDAFQAKRSAEGQNAQGQTLQGNNAK